MNTAKRIYRKTWRRSVAGGAYAKAENGRPLRFGGERPMQSATLPALEKKLAAIEAGMKRS